MICLKPTVNISNMKNVKIIMKLFRDRHIRLLCLSFILLPVIRVQLLDTEYSRLCLLFLLHTNQSHIIRKEVSAKNYEIRAFCLAARCLYSKCVTLDISLEIPTSIPHLCVTFSSCSINLTYLLNHMLSVYKQAAWSYSCWFPNFYRCHIWIN